MNPSPADPSHPFGRAGMAATASATRALGWGCRLAAAGILLQTLYFKFSGAEESVYIFARLGLEPWGRFASGVGELAAAILLLVPRTVGVGAWLAIGVMAGAVVAHLTRLGIVVREDGGLLFGLAVIVLTCALVAAYIHRRRTPIAARVLQNTTMNNLPSPNRELIHAVIETLNQGEVLLAQLSDETYARKLPVAFNASVGGHYRHCLDHFRSLLEAAEAGDLNYDHRERGTLVENDRFAALNATRELRCGFEKLDPAWLVRPLAVICKTSYAANGSQTASSTVGREIMYSVAHAVHHYALIGIMAGLMGVPLPAGFGVAPSTIKHQQDSSPTPA